MTLLVRPMPKCPNLAHLVRDYLGYIEPFTKQISGWYYLAPFILFKSMEYSVYRWYTPASRTRSTPQYEFIFKITSRCTDRCPKCGIWRQPESERVPIDLVAQAIKSIRHKVNKITVTGGEPLIFKEGVIRLCELAHEDGIPFTVVTNGYLIDEEVLQAVKKTRSNLIISLDTLNEVKWAQFRGRNHFSTVMANLSRATETARECVSIQSVRAAETEQDINLIAEYCLKHGIEHHVQDYQDFGGTWHSSAHVPSQSANGACSAWQNVCLYPNGDVVKCFDHIRIPQAKEPLGNIKRQPIAKILSSRRCTRITEMMKTCNLPCKALRCNQKPPTD